MIESEERFHISLQ
ncbi:Protein of unknown function [Bacillus mycoides]|uniref:Uncharacterized protein n=1 Tax=Bacillus mycoides TaxID=1405 RepID=A0A1D3MG85_BACMY|nr:Protein of unknown function [Bacillus mycoides]SCM84969.1 Protein of unknown function [Bacillus mycoides]